ncbi:DUF4199 domain-containing protein [Flavobacterium sp. 25HG05S-40]|uniref:DUF4199 domain-containing protein n=1 Tax=Flavobacterium sp. 25HG05S-40 TaxID=3458682 RepID=UPI004043AEB3
MEKTISPSKSALQFGVLYGIIMILELVISFSFSIDPTSNQSYGIIINLLNFVILPITFILLACNNYKNKLNAGFITLSESLKIGVTVCIIAALLYAIFSSIFNMLFPEFVEQILSSTKKAMLEQNPDMPKEQMDMALSWTEKIMSPVFAIPITLVMYAFIGLIYSLIIGAIIKKERTF